MEDQALKKEFLKDLGRCLEYPTEEACEALRCVAKQVGAISKEASDDFYQFSDYVEKMTLSAWQEYYVKTFDVTPQCGLYLSVYLFGEENYKRSELMTGLKSVYEKHAPYGMSELPDHLSVVLKQNAMFSEEEWAELVLMCLTAAIPKIVELLEKNKNPYAFLLKATQELLLKMERVYV